MSLLDGADPLDLVRLTVRVLLAGGTVVALVVWLALGEPRMLELATLLWAIYGVMRAFVSGFLSPVAALPELMSGDIRTDDAFPDAERTALTRSPEFRAADARYRTAAIPTAEVETRIGQAVGSAGTPGGAAQAVGALEALRTEGRLAARDDLRVGLALVRLHEEQLHDDAAALKEFRRLVYRHPDPFAAQEIRRALADIAPRFLPADLAENQAP